MAGQEPPRIPTNTYLSDSPLQHALRAVVPQLVAQRWLPGLTRLGSRCGCHGDAYAASVDATASPPRLDHVDAWGYRIDRITVSGGWKTLHRIAAEEGIIATAYERDDGKWSRVHQFARLLLYTASSASYSCPLAMTDGAARLLEVHMKGRRDLQQLYERLTTRDADRFYTSGQWMTERGGGSDVRQTQTVAERDTAGPTGSFRLTGAKYFSSATTADMAVTLARVVPSGQLTCFCVRIEPHPDPHNPSLNGIQVVKLKDKLGTKSLPTAELSLQGLPGVMIGAEGRGVATISTLFNVTRLYNAAAAIAGMRRGVDLARDYATRRRCFGRLLIDNELHVRTLAQLEAIVCACQAWVVECALLQGTEETLTASECATERHLLRLFTPLIKLLTAKYAVSVASEVLESFGGAGYCEDTGLPALLRDAQVLPIWEGTTNVLSLDFLRVLSSHPQALPVCLAFCTAAHAECTHSAVAEPVRVSAERAFRAVTLIHNHLIGQSSSSLLAPQSRELCLAFANAICALIALRNAARVPDAAATAAALLFAESPSRLVTSLAPLTQTTLDRDGACLRAKL